jgi:hypothetical protein
MESKIFREASFAISRLDSKVRKKRFTHFKTAEVPGLSIFYSEAGDPSKPNIVLLHGFPSSSELLQSE